MPVSIQTGRPVGTRVTGTRIQLAWVVALSVLAAASAVAADLRGRASRTTFTPGEDYQGRRWALVPDAAAAVEVWSAAGLHGRRLLVASGRWGKPVHQDGAPPAITPGDPAAQPVDRAALVSGALFEATMRGVARELVVVMPTAALDARVAAIRSARNTTLGDGWARQPYDGIPRSFHRPATVPRLDEEVLLLVEPSFFAEGAPPDLASWLAANGLRFDLALVAARDPEATPAQEEAALELAARVGAIQLEGGR
jgi:hypothetical protein